MAAGPTSSKHAAGGRRMDVTSTVTASPASASAPGHCDGSIELDYSGEFNGCDRDTQQKSRVFLFENRITKIFSVDNMYL